MSALSRSYRKVGSSLPASIAAIAMLVPMDSGRALNISEDFTYPSAADGDPLTTIGNGGTGWKTGWEGNNLILYTAANPENNPVSTNYTLEQEPNSGSLFSNTGNFRSVSRDLEHEVSGEIWFSYLFRKGATGSGGIFFNAAGTSSGPGAGSASPPEFQVAVDASSNLVVTINSIGFPAGVIANGTNYLILGRIVTGKAGSLQVWVNPELNGVTTAQEFLTSSQEPAYSSSKIDLPESLFSVGISAFRGQGKNSVFRLDALRLSDGNKDSNEAFKAVIGAGL